MLNQALQWLNNGIAVCPTLYRSKFPDCEALKSVGMIKDDKASWVSLKSSLPTTDTLKAWYGNGKLHNMAVITGWHGLAVLDFDDLRIWAIWYAWQVENNPDFLDTLIVQSSRGLHYYFYLPNLDKPIKSTHFEVKSHGAMCTTAPSVHRSGKQYKVINGSIESIKTVEDNNALFGFCPTEFKPKLPSVDPWSVVEKRNGYIPAQRVNLLDLFPDARETSTPGYFLTNCPIHGHRNNFMLNVKDGVGYCYGGCGVFLATELLEIMRTKAKAASQAASTQRKD
jgi:hypothetical protein